MAKDERKGSRSFVKSQLLKGSFNATLVASRYQKFQNEDLKKIICLALSENCFD